MEQITRIDIVRAQMLVAQGHELHGKEVAIPAQEDVPCNGRLAVFVTEDPEKDFTPDYGKSSTTVPTVSGHDGSLGDTGPSSPSTTLSSSSPLPSRPVAGSPAYAPGLA